MFNWVNCHNIKHKMIFNQASVLQFEAEFPLIIKGCLVIDNFKKSQILAVPFISFNCTT